MAPSPIVRKAVLQVLETSGRPLQFGEVCKKTSKILGRTSIDRSTVSSVLSFLRQKGIVEKNVIESKIVWSLTNRFHASTLKSSLQKLVTKAVSEDIGKTLDNGINNKSTQYTVFLIPPARDEFDVSRQAGVSVSVSWESPGKGIASILFNDYLSLPTAVSNGIAGLILWAYWTGVREKIEIFLADVIPGNNLRYIIEKNISFVEEVIAKARERNDIRQITAEQALLEILRLTKELIAKDNLADFLDFGLLVKGKVDDLMRIVLRYHGNYPAAGELLFGQFTEEFGERVFDGLISVGERERIQILLPRHMLEALDVWNGFINHLLGIADSPKVLSEIRGNLEESKEKLRKYLSFLPSLATLLKNRQVGALYLWGFPEVDAEAEREYKFSGFQDWLDAVKAGRADHRTWLFEEMTLERIRKTYRSVRLTRKPLPIRIDKEPWNLLDLYTYHPRGTDPQFWLELLEVIEERNAPRHVEHRRRAVPPGNYSLMNKREREYVTRMLDEEESEAIQGKTSRKPSTGGSESLLEASETC